MLTQEDLQYIRKQNSCGIKVGDKVKVLRKAEDYENGWGDMWDDAMVEFIGKICIVQSNQDHNGFELFFNKHIYGFYFPYFVLEKVEEYKSVSPINSCPQCEGKLKEVYSEWAGENIKKCSNCGWC